MFHQQPEQLLGAFVERIVAGIGTHRRVAALTQAYVTKDILLMRDHCRQAR
jgi:hypothetical protein